MPTYEYACKDCGEKLEVVQSIHDDSLTTCPKCGGTLRKLFGNVGVVFKGSGFYKTDSRSKSSSTGSGSSSPSPSPEKKAETKAESKPASSDSSGGSSSSSSTATPAAS